MTGDDSRPVEASADRTAMGCRVSESTQRRFATFVDEHLGNRRGAYGYAVEKAMEEYMDNDRYARVEDRLSAVEETVQHTNALVRQIVTAEKEKGAFLEPAPTGNQVGDRRERENSVIEELARRCVRKDHAREFKEGELNEVITDVAGVASDPSKRDYRESLIDRGMLEARYGSYELTTTGFRLAGYELDTIDEEVDAGE